jgi:hypothetical protein
MSASSILVVRSEVLDIDHVLAHQSRDLLGELRRLGAPRYPTRRRRM